MVGWLCPGIGHFIEPRTGGPAGAKYLGRVSAALSVVLPLTVWPSKTL